MMQDSYTVRTANATHLVVEKLGWAAVCRHEMKEKYLCHHRSNILNTKFIAYGKEV
ncbi:hypothetical protein [Prevotella intermedia]|uniref:hypothetical protein n=1 Tax=Prevotella intermedia TaxID=28131 RepID=UPI0012FD2E99|nr:hypothetical protein [Prevotella intermedia]